MVLKIDTREWMSLVPAGPTLAFRAHAEVDQARVRLTAAGASLNSSHPIGGCRVRRRCQRRRRISPLKRHLFALRSAHDAAALAECISFS